MPTFASGAMPTFASGAMPIFASGAMPTFASGAMPTFASGEVHRPGHAVGNQRGQPAGELGGHRLLMGQVKARVDRRPVAS